MGSPGDAGPPGRVGWNKAVQLDSFGPLFGLGPGPSRTRAEGEWGSTVDVRSSEGLGALLRPLPPYLEGGAVSDALGARGGRNLVSSDLSL